MSISIAGLSFDGPFSSVDYLNDRSGIYTILCKKNDGKYYVLDVGESKEVKSRVASHDRQPCWNTNNTGELSVAVYYTPHLQKHGRLEIEQKVRAQYNPTCGER